jgi:hypothetical protein
VWMGALSSWKTALFGNNIWIMECTWLPNLSTYSLAVIRPWWVIMGQTEYCSTILPPKPSHNLSGIPDCRLSWVFSKRKLFLLKGTAWRTTHLTISRKNLHLYTGSNYR